jgi:hypothetical protein
MRPEDRSADQVRIWDLRTGQQSGEDIGPEDRSAVQVRICDLRTGQQIRLGYET